MLGNANGRRIANHPEHDADEPIPDDVEFGDGVRVLNDRHKKRKCHLPASIRFRLAPVESHAAIAVPTPITIKSPISES
jgi:hypothetical protein